MSRFKLVSLVFIAILLLAVCKAQTTVPPNIVWITSEDNSKHYLKLFDNNGVNTPNIESLADHGLIFDHAFSNAPVCSVARSTLISGCYGPRVGSQYHRKLKMVPMPTGVRMFPAYLRDAGYYTTNNHKEDYNFIKPDDVWDESSKEASYRNRKPGQPFFHVFNIGTTHESGLHFTEEEMAVHTTLTDQSSFTINPNHPETPLFRFTNAYYRDKIIKMDEQVGEVVEQLKADGLFDDTFIFYYGDHGGVLPGSKGYLYETGLHVPLVIHVPKNYTHLVNPVLATRVKGFVSFVDFGPTVLNLAGLEIPEGIDGKPFLGPDIIVDELNRRDETFSYADRFDEKYDLVRALRKGKFKYIRSYQPFNYDGLMNNYRYIQLAYKEWLHLYEKGELNPIQSRFFEPREVELLFDVEADPYETTNLVSDPAHAVVLQALRDKLTRKLKRMPDLSFYPEHFLVNSAFEDPAKFGQQHKTEIQSYIDIANLGLFNFNKVRTLLKTSLNSDDSWKRYWGLTVCSSFAEEASEFTPLIKQIADSDAEIINKVRAAEFLGIIKADDPSRIMTDALYKTKDGAQALLILNSIVLMTNGFSKSTFNIQLEKIASNVREDIQVKRRLEYLKIL